MAMTVKRMLELVKIGDRVLGGAPIESFGLTDDERDVVLKYTSTAVDMMMGGSE